MSSQRSTPLPQGKAEATLSATVHLSLSPAKLRELADKADKLIQECPSLHAPENYFQIEHYAMVSQGCQVYLRLFADWKS